ncbi:MAG: NifB/NifX family molybdenum-iron cluster-binding protein [Candidatus Kapabacteria bacterium]|jgi:predicted Fe-Mo cluster-binding NifX family protein|nr:NifB/NifX family molybdenum-iron cluster-binding protein [Candidatus Kapabacteria bacterium]
MKICIPTTKDQGLDSVAYGHFGSAPVFIVYDTLTHELYAIENTNSEHGHGGCNPASLMNEHNVNAVVVSGIGANAMQKLSASGIKIFRTSDYFHVFDIIEQLKNDILFEMNPQDKCLEHNCEHYD